MVTTEKDPNIKIINIKFGDHYENTKHQKNGVGATGAVLYIGCIILMVSVGREGTIFFFNSLLHGLNVEPIIRMSVPPLDALFGIIQTFILGWLVGALIAAIYNIGIDQNAQEESRPS